MREVLMLLLAFTITLCMVACGGSPPSESASEPTPQGATETPDGSAGASSEEIELIVFAAASMTETMQEIALLYKEAAPNVKLVFNFDSSGTLKTQIQEGAPCDLFISAGLKQMDQLDIDAPSDTNTESLDFVRKGSRVNLLENKVVLVVPDGNPKGVNSFDQLASLLSEGNILMAMGNSDVPVGQYTQKILTYYELDEAALASSGVLTCGSNVKEVATQVTEASVDCGVVYSTDAFSAGLTAVDFATAEMCGQVIYPAAVMNISEHSSEAEAFLDFLQSSSAMQKFENIGFSPA